MRDFIDWLDPYHQSPLFFKWSFWSVLFVIGVSVWLFMHTDYKIAPILLGETPSTFTHTLFDNMWVYFPNYLNHEMLGHNLVGKFGLFLGMSVCYPHCIPFAMWWCVAMGNGVETLVPLVVLLFTLRSRGGRYLLPVWWYWLGSTFYEAGVYAADARASQLPLTSADMLTNFKPGAVKGDWYNILGPIGLLDYDVIIGQIFIFIGAVCVVIAVFSLYYYWKHNEEYLKNSLSSGWI